jgi:hypothetical protein
MRLKAIVRRGAGYARRRDRSQYEYTRSRHPNVTEAQIGREARGCFQGCFAAILVFISFGLGFAFVESGWRAMTSWQAGGEIQLICGVSWLILNCCVLYFILNRKQPEQSDGSEIERDSSRGIDTKYLIGCCHKCAQKLEFPACGLGTEIQCPTCGSTIVLSL